MKKLIKIIIVLIISFFISFKVDAAANTLADLKKELQDLKYEKAQNDAAKSKTQSEINAENSKISNAHNEVEKAEEDIKQAKILIENSSQEGELVLDFTMGSGSTGVACLNTGRDFIGIELDENYFEIAQDRINKGE